ncbi:myb-related transcription factor, partner of profilin [Esox lucius]|uniref:Myb/SANT-like DNA-binding domain-containing protein n=1 Tax=Esox lucius TaxID=8010 RepID=A0A3P8YLX1_ESOLU|nr:myb-related transcription factor, partner of profilin [Esox lucius]XP_019903419.1 myb-related transcription factor, partner of profilin [Esox lucius]
MSASHFFNEDSVTRFKKRKARFTFSEVHILLDEVKKNRHIVVGKFNRGVPTDVKKRAWAEITAHVNEIGESQREVIEIIKKWSDLKCDTKRKVAAMRSGANFKGINSRLSRDLSPTENIVHQILELDGKRSRVSGVPYGSYREGEDDEGPEEDEEEEDMAGIHSYPNEGIEASMPPPSTLSSGMPMSFPIGMSMQGPIPPLQPKDDHSMTNYSGLSRDPSHPTYEMQYEIPTGEDTENQFGESDDERQDELLPSTPQMSSLAEEKPGSASITQRPSTGTQPSPSLTSSAPPRPGQPPRNARETMLQSATLSVQEQHATNAVLETVSRSLELLSESVQQLAETQQEFVRESLQLQRETMHILRDFTSGALALMNDKLNGRPAL